MPRWLPSRPFHAFRPDPRWRALRLFVRGLAALGLLLFVLRKVDLQALGDSLASAPGWAWAVPATLLGVNSVVHALRIRLLFPSPRPRVTAVLRCILLGNFVGMALPTGGGEAMKALGLSRLSAKPGDAVMALLTSRLLELPPWGLLVWWGAWAVLPGRLDSWVPVAWVVGLVFIGVFVVAVGVHAYAGAVLDGPRAGRVPARIRERIAGFAAFRPPLVNVALCGLGAVPFAALNCLVVWSLLVAVGWPVPYSDVLGLIPSMDVVISLPLTVAGAGVRETMFCHALAPWGVPAEVALTVCWLRWSGDVFRATLGGLWWGLAGSVTPAPSPERDVVFTAPARLPTGALAQPDKDGHEV